jgi:hypothetical protein
MYINKHELWDCFNAERRKAWEGHEDAEVGSPEWNECAAKIDVINNICHYAANMNAAPRSDADKAMKPIWKSGESIVHSDYADGHGETKLHQWAAWVCPVCEWFVGEQFIPLWAGRKPHNQNKCNFCARCGQRIDWQSVELGDDDEP